MSGDEKIDLRRVLVGAAGTILAGLVLQSGALLWWAGRMDARMAGAERSIEQLHQRLAAVEGRAK